MRNKSAKLWLEKKKNENPQAIWFPKSGGFWGEVLPKIVRPKEFGRGDQQVQNLAMSRERKETPREHETESSGGLFEM